MSKLFAIEARDVNDLVYMFSGMSPANTPVADMPSTFPANGFEMAYDTENLPTLIKEIADTDDAALYMVTLIDATTDEYYNPPITTEFAGRRPVHHPR